MKLQAVIHVAEEGGFWAEVPALPGCAFREAIAGWLDADVAEPKPGARERVLELAL